MIAMVKASGVEVLFDAQKKSWVVRIQAGEEVIRRTCKNSKGNLTDEELRSLALQTARDDGYELQPGAVVVKR